MKREGGDGGEIEQGLRVWKVGGEGGGEGGCMLL